MSFESNDQAGPQEPSKKTFLSPSFDVFPDKMPAGIARKLNLVSKDISNPQKSAILKQFNYKYSNRDDVAQVLRVVLNAHNLMARSKPFHIERDVFKMGRELVVFYMVTVRIMIIDSDTGEYWLEDVFGESMDRSDKGLAKAYTSALRHWAINNFWLTDGGEEYLYVDEMKESQNRRPSRPSQDYPNNPKNAVIFPTDQPEQNYEYLEREYKEMFYQKLAPVGLSPEIQQKFLELSLKEGKGNIKRLQAMINKLKIINPLALKESVLNFTSKHDHSDD